MTVHENMETLYPMIPMELWPTEYLPDDYKGPSAGSMKDIAGKLPYFPKLFIQTGYFFI